MSKRNRASRSPNLLTRSPLNNPIGVWFGSVEDPRFATFKPGDFPTSPPVQLHRGDSSTSEMKHGLLSNPFDVLQVDESSVVGTKEHVLGYNVGINGGADRQSPSRDHSNLIVDFI